MNFHLRRLSHVRIALLCCAAIGAIPATAGELPTTTVIVHGFTTGSKGAWVQAMGQAILARAPGGGSLFRYVGSGAGGGRWTYVPTPQGNGTFGHIVLIFNWVPESAGPSAGPNWNYVQAAADVMYAMLRSPKYSGLIGPADLARDRAMHFIGHSRGACVNSEAVRRFALANIPVDQFTSHDPHPVNGTLDPRYDYDWGDPVPVRWSNTAWADNYWRADGGGLINGLDFDGIPLPNVFNTQLNESALNCCAYTFAHSDVHLWYHGTVDTSPTPCDGEQCINAQMRSTWWPEGWTERGFYYSQIGGGSANRPAIPAGATPAPGSVETLYNGTLVQGTYAGWTYHGGAINGQIASESGNWFLRVGAGQGGSSATHNRFFLPANASAVVLDSRIFAAAADESLEIVLNDVSDELAISSVIGAVALSSVGGWIADQSFPIGCAIPRGRLFTLTLRIAAGGTVDATVGIDNVRVMSGVTPAGDATGDGLVTIDDLLAVISAWGDCPPPPLSCPADVAPIPGGDGQVDIDDLLQVIATWGMCS